MGIRLMVIFNPCRDCAERRVGCHSGCEWYKRYTEEVKALNAVIKADDSYSAYILETYVRNRWDALTREKKKGAKR